MPGNRCAPVVADHTYLLLTVLIHGRLDIGADGQQVIGCRITRRAALAIAAHFRDQHAVSGSGQRRNLLAPGMPALGKAVQQPDRPPRGGAGTVQAEVDTVDLKDLLFKLMHRRLHLTEATMTKAHPEVRLY